jgi:catabolite regulation protein CreA
MTRRSKIAVALSFAAPASADQAGDVNVEGIGNESIFEAAGDPDVSGVTRHSACFEPDLAHERNQVFVHVAHAGELADGSARMAISTALLDFPGS